MKSTAWLELLLLGAIWGGSFPFLRVAVPEFGPVALIAMRLAIAAAFLTVVLASRSGFGALRGRWSDLAVLGALNTAVPFTLFAYAAGALPAGFTAVLNATVPLCGAILAVTWSGQRLSGRRLLGLGLGFAGVLVLLGPKLRGDANVLPIAAGLLAALCYAIAALYTKSRLAAIDPLAVSTGSTLTSTAMLLPVAAFLWPAQPPSTGAWGCALALGSVCTAIAYVLYFRLIRALGALRATTVTYLIPVFGMTWGALFLREPVTPTMLGGCTLILLGVATVTRPAPVVPTITNPGATR